MNFNNIKVDIYGQFNDVTAHGYTYPEPKREEEESLFSEDNEWLVPLEDILSQRNNLGSEAPQVYMLYSDTNGIYYSLILPDGSDNSRQHLALTLFVAAGSEKLSGKTVVKVLEGLKNALSADNKLNSEAVELVLTEADVPQNSGKMPVISPLTTSTSRPYAYREYTSEDELELIFDNPHQPLYTSYHGIFMVASQFAPEETMLDHLTQPIAREYRVEMKADNCTLRDKTVRDGQLLTLLFTREGFKPARLRFVVGQTTPQGISFEGDVMTVTEPLGIQWRAVDSKPKPAHTAPAFEDKSHNIDTSGDEIAPHKPNSGNGRGWLTLIIILAMAGVFWWWLSGDDNKHSPSLADVVNTKVDESSADASKASNAEQAPAPIANTPQEQALYEKDVKYMKDNKTWKKEEIKSQKGKQVIAAMEKGDVKGLINCEYYRDNSDNDNINKDFKQIVELLAKMDEKKTTEATKWIAERGKGEKVPVFQMLYNVDDISKGKNPDH